eukprot:jgi/Mesvir1/786/Mv17384-RA.1
MAAEGSAGHATAPADWHPVAPNEGKPRKSSELQARTHIAHDIREAIGFKELHHAGLLCRDLEKSLEFYCGRLGLTFSLDRPDEKLPYRGAWLWVGNQMIHLMELPNPDPLEGRPAHAGADRHVCMNVKNIAAIAASMDKAGVPYTMSRSGRQALFTRDPDGNGLEFAQV